MRIVVRPLCVVSVSMALLCSVGCLGSFQTESQRREAERQRRDDADSAAGKLGKVAHSVAVQSGKAANAVGRDLSKAARQAHAGWQEAAQQDKKKQQ